MNDQKVSIIMPAYNQEKYIGQAIESVICQTYENWELIIVDDGSVDNTKAIIANHKDPRIRYFYQPKQGVCEARNLGLHESVGDHIAFLDADDLFHPEKLREQVDCLNRHPNAGLVFVSRIEIDQDGNPLGFFSYDEEVTLTSLVLTFPFAPSDLMLRKQWVRKVGGFNHSYIVNEDRDWYIRLFYEGCQCKGIKRFLSYRRLDQMKSFRDLAPKMNDMLKALGVAFDDLRCPADVIAVKDHAYQNIYLAWFYQSALQGEGGLADEYFNKVIQLTPAMRRGNTEEFEEFILHTSIRDGGEHEQRLRIVHSLIPAEGRQSEDKIALLIGRGYLLRGIRAALWGRCDEAENCFQKAKTINLANEISLASAISDWLMKYETAFGVEKAEQAAERVFTNLQNHFKARDVDSIVAAYSFNQAFDAFRERNYNRAIHNTTRVLRKKPSLLLNRGLFSIFWKSIIR